MGNITSNISRIDDNDRKKIFKKINPTVSQDKDCSFQAQYSNTYKSNYSYVIKKNGLRDCQKINDVKDQNIKSQEIKDVITNDEYDLNDNNLYNNNYNMQSNTSLEEINNYSVYGVIGIKEAEETELLIQNKIILQQGKLLQKTKLNKDSQNEYYFNKISKYLLDKNYIIKQYLTSGGQADIFIAYINGQEVVIKIYSDIIEEEFDEEVDLINSIKEPINVLGNIEIIKLRNINVYIIVQEHCEVSLKDELELFKSNQKEFTQLNLLLMVFDLLDGLIEMRSHNIIHQDIKPANILKTYSGKYVYIDFGCSTKSKDGKAKLKGYTLNYCAPEQVKGDVNYQSDVYSLGKTLQKVIKTYKQNQNLMDKTNQDQADIAKEFDCLISEKMLRENYKEREDIMGLFKQFFQIIKKLEFFEFMLEYKDKLHQITELFPFDNNKDIRYFSNVHLQYCLIQFEILKFIKFNSQQINAQNKTDIEIIDDLEITFCLNKIGNCYYSLGQYDVGLKFLLECLENMRIVYYGNNLNIADLLNDIGSCYLELGQNDLALKFYQKSYEMNKIMFCGNHRNIAICLNNIGYCYGRLGQHDLALKFCLESLEMYKIVFNGYNYCIADSLNNIGICLKQIGKYDSALQFCLESYEMKQMLFDGNNSSMAQSLNNVGICYKKLGQYDLALKFQLESLEMNKTLFSGNHSNIANCLKNIGLCYKSIGQYDLALKFQLESLEMNKTLFSGNHSNIANCLKNIGLCYEKLGQYDLALKFQLESLVMNKLLFSDNHQEIANSLKIVGFCYNKLCQYDLALKYQLESLEMNQKIYPSNHQKIACSLTFVGICYKNLLQYDEALKFLQQSLEMKMMPLQINHLSIADTFSNIGFCYIQLGQYKQALEYLKKSVVRQKILSNNPQNIITGLNDIGKCYEKLGEYDLALKQYLESLKMSKSIFKDNDSLIQYPLKMSLQIYCLQNQQDLAVELMNEFKDIVMTNIDVDLNYPIFSNLQKIYQSNKQS